MGMAHISIALAVTLTGLLPSSCSKTHPPDAKPAKAAVTVTPANVKNLGELILTNHYETRIELGAGKSCTITPKVLDKNNVQLTMAVESLNSKGHTAGFSVAEVVASRGKPFEVAVGELNISLTPNVASP